MMRALLTSILLISFASEALGQGYILGFNAFKPIGRSEVAYVRGRPENAHSIAPLLSKQFGRVEILSFDQSMILSPTKDGSGDRLVVDGIFALGVIAIPFSTPGTPASIILRIWDSSTGDTYAGALYRNATLVTFPSVGGREDPWPSNFVLNSNFTGLEIYNYGIPEPSSLALAAIGLVGLVLCVRRAKGRTREGTRCQTL